MKNIGVAVVGTGFMGWVHVETLRRVGVQVVGICGSSAEKSVAAQQRLGLQRAFANLDEVLADEQVDSVHICTPNGLHFDMARRALAAGKHVMCEKPLATTPAESAELVRLAAGAKSQAAAVNYNIRYYPLCLEARQRVQSGELGAVFHVTGSYVQDWLALPTDYNWRVLAEAGGPLRAVADIGTHWLDLIHFITGLQVEAVCGDLQTVHPMRYRPHGEIETFQGKTAETAVVGEPVPITTDDYGAILLRFRGGARGCLHVSQVIAGRKNCLRLEIAGSNCAIAWNSEEANQLWIGRRQRANELLIRDPALLSEAARAAADYPGGHNEGYADSFKQCFGAFYQYVRCGDFAAPPTFPTFADGHREAALGEAILASARQQRWVTLGAEP